MITELKGTESRYQQDVHEVGCGVPYEGLIERLIPSHSKGSEGGHMDSAIDIGYAGSQSTLRSYNMILLHCSLDIRSGDQVRHGNRAFCSKANRDLQPES